jgi:hypothetical protein
MDRTISTNYQHSFNNHSVLLLASFSVLLPDPTDFIETLPDRCLTLNAFGKSQDLHPSGSPVFHVLL